MESKFLIFLVFAIVAKFLVLGSIDSCIPPNNIGAELAVIDFGKNTALEGLARVNKIIFDVLRAILAEATRGHNSKSKDNDFKIPFAKNITVTALMIGIPTTYEALKAIKRDLDVQSSTASTLLKMQQVADYIYDAIKLAEGKDSSKNLAKIKDIEANLQAAGAGLIAGLFNSVLTSDYKFSAKTTKLINCIENTTAAEIVNGFEGIFDGIYHLRDALNKETKVGKEDTLNAFAAAQNKSMTAFNAEVTDKFAVIRSVKIAQFVSEVEIVDGLLALESDIGKTYF